MLPQVVHLPPPTDPAPALLLEWRLGDALNPEHPGGAYPVIIQGVGDEAWRTYGAVTLTVTGRLIELDASRGLFLNSDALAFTVGMRRYRIKRASGKYVLTDDSDGRGLEAASSHHPPPPQSRLGVGAAQCPAYPPFRCTPQVAVPGKAPPGYEEAGVSSSLCVPKALLELAAISHSHVWPAASGDVTVHAAVMASGGGLLRAAPAPGGGPPPPPARTSWSGRTVAVGTVVIPAEDAAGMSVVLADALDCDDGCRMPPVKLPRGGLLSDSRTLWLLWSARRADVAWWQARDVTGIGATLPDLMSSLELCEFLQLRADTQLYRALRVALLEAVARCSERGALETLCVSLRARPWPDAIGVEDVMAAATGRMRQIVGRMRQFQN